jgi:hypothetical protein
MSWYSRVLLSLFVLSAGTVVGDDGDPAVLDGSPKSFVVVGYSTSFIWPDMLQSMLDQHSGKTGVYHVLNGAVGGSPVVSWLHGHKKYEKTYGKLLHDYLSDTGSKLEGRPVPAVALCQQSLQGAFGERRAGIRGSDDAERIEHGADTFLRLADQLHTDGLKQVYIAAHIYKVTMESEIGNEQYALQALLDRKLDYVKAGPELWQPTKDAYPDGFSIADKVHPSVSGARIMAEGWYRALAGNQVKEDIVRAMYADPFPELVKKEDVRESRRVERQKQRGGG